MGYFKLTSLQVIIAIFFLLLFPFKVISEIYQWTDENGDVHFSDKASMPEGVDNLETVFDESTSNNPDNLIKAKSFDDREMRTLPDGSMYPAPRTPAEIEDYVEAVNKVANKKREEAMQRIESMRQGKFNRSQSADEYTSQQVTDGNVSQEYSVQEDNREPSQTEVVYDNTQNTSQQESADTVTQENSVQESRLESPESDMSNSSSQETVQAEDEPVSDAQKYLQAHESETIYGPAQVQIRNKAVMDIIYGQAFIPEEIVSVFFQKLGDKNDNIAGMIIPGIPGEEPPEDDWGFILLEFLETGHIPDDEAEQKDFSDLMEKITNNAKRNPNLTILNWINKPQYDSNNHVFSWSYDMVNGTDKYQDIYQSFILGRTELIAFIYVSKTEERSLRQPLVKQITNSISFNHGYSYPDYIAGSDKLSEAGLTGLVVGTAVAKKLGLFAMMLAVLAKLGKFIGIIIGAALVIFKIKKRRQ